MTTLTRSTDEIIIKVSLMEAALIKLLRRYDFGEFRIIKMSGEPRRVVRVEGSEMLSRKDGLALAIDIPKERNNNYKQEKERILS